MGDIGEPIKTIEFEPLENPGVPVYPQPPAVPVPAGPPTTEPEPQAPVEPAHEPNPEEVPA